MIPASFEYTGPVFRPKNYGDWKNDFFVTLGPSDRAIPLLPQTSSGGASQSSGGAGSSQSNGDASSSLCGPVSCSVLQDLRKGVRDAEAERAAAEDRQKQAQAAEAQRQSERAAIAPPPASPPAIDRFGSGGFTTPPTSFNALMCLPADLAHNSSWKPGSKMAAFQDMAARYIASVAKPGWQYWISQAQYERFNPATSTSGDQFVSAVSPDSGRFDEFDPQCPSGYEGFWVQVHH